MATKAWINMEYQEQYQHAWQPPTPDPVSTNHTIGGGYVLMLAVTKNREKSYATFCRGTQRHTLTDYRCSMLIEGTIYALCLRGDVYRVYRITPDMCSTRIIRLYKFAVPTAPTTGYAFPPADGVNIHLSDTLSEIYANYHFRPADNDPIVYHWAPQLGHRIDARGLAFIATDAHGCVSTHCVLDPLYRVKRGIVATLPNCQYSLHTDILTRLTIIAQCQPVVGSACVVGEKVKYHSKDSKNFATAVAVAPSTSPSVIQAFYDTVHNTLPRDIVDIVCMYLGQVEIQVSGRTHYVPSDLLKNSRWTDQNDSVGVAWNGRPR